MTGYLGGDLAAARTPGGYLQVTPELGVVGFDRVYALGDIAAIDVNKAGVAGRQATVVATNIRAQLTGTGEHISYTPGPTAIILPLGPTGGAGQLPGRDDIAPAELISQIKGRAMMIDRYPAPRRPHGPATLIDPARAGAFRWRCPPRLRRRQSPR